MAAVLRECGGDRTRVHRFVLRLPAVAKTSLPHTHPAVRHHAEIPARPHRLPSWSSRAPTVLHGGRSARFALSRAPVHLTSVPHCAVDSRDHLSRRKFAPGDLVGGRSSIFSYALILKRFRNLDDHTSYPQKCPGALIAGVEHLPRRRPTDLTGEVTAPRACSPADNARSGCATRTWEVTG